MTDVIDFESFLPTETVEEDTEIVRDSRYDDTVLDWTFNDTTDFEIPEGHETFVYRITNKINGLQYIGFKTLVSKKIKVSKGRRHHLKVESDWKDYFSSSDNLRRDVYRYGRGNFKREILAFTVNKAVGKFVELYLQLSLGVLTHNRDKYYNNIVNVRLNGLTVGKYTQIVWCDEYEDTLI